MLCDERRWRGLIDAMNQSILVPELGWLCPLMLLTVVVKEEGQSEDSTKAPGSSERGSRTADSSRTHAAPHTARDLQGLALIM